MERRVYKSRPVRSAAVGAGRAHEFSVAPSVRNRSGILTQLLFSGRVTAPKLLSRRNTRD